MLNWKNVKECQIMLQLKWQNVTVKMAIFFNLNIPLDGAASSVKKFCVTVYVFSFFLIKQASL
jgi:hypothetical protein